MTTIESLSLTRFDWREAITLARAFRWRPEQAAYLTGEPQTLSDADAASLTAALRLALAAGEGQWSRPRPSRAAVVALANALDAGARDVNAAGAA